MRYILTDTPALHANLLPISYTRPVSELRIGILTLRQKWEKRLPGEYSYVTADYLTELFPCIAEDCDSETVTIDSSFIASDQLAAAVASLGEGCALRTPMGELIACRGKETACVTHPHPVSRVEKITDVFTLNAQEIEHDFALLAAGRKSQALHESVTVIGTTEKIFVEEGATLLNCSLNTNGGPIYIGSHAEVMEYAALRGPVAVCEHSAVNMGAKIYGATTVGPWSKVGGELNNVVIHSYSNKAHDGFLGNAVIGSWCNIGAGCVASNLKNDYTEIKLWNYPSHRFLRTGLQFCGLIMADHSKAGINTMFNTATVVGVGVNIHGSGFPRNFVASFSDGGAAGFSEVSMTKFFDTASRAMARRGKELSEADRRLFHAIRSISENYK